MTPTEKLQYLVNRKIIGQKLANNILAKGKAEEFVDRFAESCNKTALEWTGKKYNPFDNLR